MPAGNPKGTGPSAEARARSAATRRRVKNNHMAADLKADGWLVICPADRERFTAMFGDIWDRWQTLRDPIAHGGAQGMPCVPCSGPCRFPY